MNKLLTMAVCLIVVGFLASGCWATMGAVKNEVAKAKTEIAVEQSKQTDIKIEQGLARVKTEINADQTKQIDTKIGQVSESIDNLNTKLETNLDKLSKNMTETLEEKLEALKQELSKIKEWQKNLEGVNTNMENIIINRYYSNTMKKATQLYQKKKYEESIMAYQESLKIADFDPSVYYNIACCYSLMNKGEDAIDWLEKSIIHGFTNYGHMVQDTDLDNIRNTPKFKELITKYNLIIEEKTDILILKGFDPYTTANGNQQTVTSYCYLVGCPKTKEAVIIDPSGGEEEIKKCLKENGLTLKYIFVTHAHHDHNLGLKGWLEEGMVKVYFHEASVEEFQKHTGYENVGGVKDGEKIEIGTLAFTAMHIPGHSPDGVSFYLEKEGRLFSGDTLSFSPDHISPEIKEYFQKYFSGIKDDTKVYSGHAGYKLFSDIKKMVLE